MVLIRCLFAVWLAVVELGGKWGIYHVSDVEVDAPDAVGCLLSGGME